MVDQAALLKHLDLSELFLRFTELGTRILRPGLEIADRGGEILPALASSLGKGRIGEMIDVPDPAGFFLNLDLVAQVIDKLLKILDHHLDLGEFLLLLVDFKSPQLQGSLM